MKLIRSREKLKDKGREFVVSREKTPSRILENVNENLNCEPVARSFPSSVYRTHGVDETPLHYPAGFEAEGGSSRCETTRC